MSTTVTVFSDVDSPSPGFSTTTVSPAKEELGPGWAMDDVYPPLAELRRALLTDEEWAAMSSWEKDVWEMYYRPDWERLACIEQILVDTPAAQRVERHEEILEALRNLGASASKLAFKPASAAAANSSIAHLGTSQAVPVDAASSVIIEEGPEVALSVSTSFITTAPVTCSIDCLPQQSMVAPVLVVSLPPIPTEYILDINRIRVAAVPLAMKVEFPAVAASTDSTPTVQLQKLYNDREFFMATSGQCITTKVHVHRPMSWPSFLDVHAKGDETRPLPWPSFRICAAVEFPILDAYGMVRSLELKLLPNGSTSITLLTVSFDSGNCAALSCEYLAVDTTDCVGSWLFVGFSAVVCPESSVQSTIDCYMAIEFVVVQLPIMERHLLDFSYISVVPACFLDHYLCSSQLHELVDLNTIRRSVSSDGQFSCHTPWPPPLLYLNWCDSSKSRPIPWPAFAGPPGSVHLTKQKPPLQGTSGDFSITVAVMYHFSVSLCSIGPLHNCLQCELCQEENVTNVWRSREAQFHSLGASLNISDNFLKKPCAESKEADFSYTCTDAPNCKREFIKQNNNGRRRFGTMRKSVASLFSI